MSQRRGFFRIIARVLIAALFTSQWAAAGDGLSDFPPLELAAPTEVPGTCAIPTLQGPMTFLKKRAAEARRNRLYQQNAVNQLDKEVGVLTHRVNTNSGIAITVGIAIGALIAIYAAELYGTGITLSALKRLIWSNSSKVTDVSTKVKKMLMSAIGTLGIAETLRRYLYNINGSTPTTDISYFETQLQGSIRVMEYQYNKEILPKMPSDILAVVSSEQAKAQIADYFRDMDQIQIYMSNLFLQAALSGPEHDRFWMLGRDTRDRKAVMQAASNLKLKLYESEERAANTFLKDLSQVCITGHLEDLHHPGVVVKYDPKAIQDGKGFFKKDVAIQEERPQPKKEAASGS